MPPKRQWIDKKNATKYQLFHRSQNDPLIHDPEAEDRVLHQVSGPKVDGKPISSSASTASRNSGRHLADLENEFKTESIRKNEGEAANYGIYYDDTKYDYMQHLRELGTGGGNSYFVEAKKGKGKEKAVKLEDALRDFNLDDSKSQITSGSASVHDSQYAPSGMSSYSRQRTYQDQQDIPDAIAGFQPNMDPRLRETLEALEDEAFVDDEDGEDIFGELVKDGEEVHPGDWEDTLYDYAEEDDGWESDATEKAFPQSTTTTTENSSGPKISNAQTHDPSEMPNHDHPVPDMAPENSDWMHEFAKFKKDVKNSSKTPAAAAAVAGEASEQRTAASTMFTVGGTPVRRKKRKGALTNPSAYSMTSSSLARTDGLRLLDDRFEKVEAMYALDEEGEYDDGASMVSGMTGMTGVTGMTGASAASSQAPSLVSRRDYGDVPLRSDFDNVMDDFLSGWQDRSKQTKHKGAKAKRGKNGNEAIGIAMLDEIRQGLGPARVSSKSKA